MDIKHINIILSKFINREPVKISQFGFYKIRFSCLILFVIITLIYV